MTLPQPRRETLRGLTHRSLALAVERGRKAAEDGKPSTVCPYDVAAEDGTIEKVRANAWLRGYVVARGERVG